MVVIDEDTKATHRSALDHAVSDLEYGTVAVNTIPALAFTNPYLIWSGNEEGDEFVSGRGNFGGPRAPLQERLSMSARPWHPD